MIDIIGCRDDSGLSRIERLQRCNELDRKFGYESLRDSSVHLGWLINMHPVRAMC